MFDVAFSELVVIGVVALIVIGPERLPKVARAAGILLGRLQRYVGDVKADISREMQLEELKKMQSDVAAQVMNMEQSVNAQLKTVETELNESITAGIEEKAGAAPATGVIADAAGQTPATIVAADAAAIPPPNPATPVAFPAETISPAPIPPAERPPA